MPAPKPLPGSALPVNYVDRFYVALDESGMARLALGVDVGDKEPSYRHILQMTRANALELAQLIIKLNEQLKGPPAN